MSGNSASKLAAAATEIMSSRGTVMTDQEAFEFLRPICANCGLSEPKHRNGKCLFEPTNFVFGGYPGGEE